MNGLPYIPGRTRLEIAKPAPMGQRHEQAKRIACSLAGQGLAADAIFAQLRVLYDATITDRELTEIVAWATRQGFTPCTPSFTVGRTHPKLLPQSKPVDPVANIKRFLGDLTANECDLWHESPWRPQEVWRDDAVMFLAGMYHVGELVNIVTDYYVDPKDEKAKPKGYGITKSRDDWMRHIRDHGTPEGNGGAWVRMNPIDGKGITDENIIAFRFALIELDTVPMELQLSLLAKLPLPVNAIVTSAGRSAQAWVRVNAKSIEGYRATVKELLAILNPYGVDQANKNPSRLSRLPGAQRKIGGTGDGQQRLFYLAPDRTDSTPILRG